MLLRCALAFGSLYLCMIMYVMSTIYVKSFQFDSEKV